MGTLDGKVVLITGTGGGLGRVAALIFAREGAKVVGCRPPGRRQRRDGRTRPPRRRRDDRHRAGRPHRPRAGTQARRGRRGRLRRARRRLQQRGRAPLRPDAGLLRARTGGTTITGELDIPYFVSKFAWPHLVRRGGGVIINAASMAGMIGGHVPPMVGAHRRERRHHRHDATARARRRAATASARWRSAPGPPSPRPATATSVTTRRPGTRSPPRRSSSASRAPRRSSNWWSSSPPTGRRTSPGANYPVDGGATAW